MEKYAKELTKKMLQDYGIVDVTYDESKGEWNVLRYWYKPGRSLQKTTKKVSISFATCKHKYSADRQYLKVTFSKDGKSISIPLARLIYVWFKGDVKEGEVIDHIDNNPFNNNPDNLQRLNFKDNSAKRFIDNPNSAKNQYSYIYKLIHEYYKQGFTDKEVSEKIDKLLKQS